MAIDHAQSRDLERMRARRKGETLTAAEVRASGTATLGLLDESRELSDRVARLEAVSGADSGSIVALPALVAAVRIDGVLVAGVERGGGTVDGVLPELVGAERVTYDVLCRGLASRSGVGGGRGRVENLSPYLGRPAAYRQASETGERLEWPAAFTVGTRDEGRPGAESIRTRGAWSGQITPCRPFDPCALHVVTRRAGGPRSGGSMSEAVMGPADGADRQTIRVVRLEVMTERGMGGETVYRISDVAVVSGFEPGNPGAGGGGMWDYTVQAGTRGLDRSFVPMQDAGGDPVTYLAHNTQEDGGGAAGALHPDLRDDPGLVIEPVGFNNPDRVVRGRLVMKPDPANAGELVAVVEFSEPNPVSVQCPDSGGVGSVRTAGAT